MPDLPGGAQFYPEYLTRTEQTELIDCVRERLTGAPLFQPSMPRTGQPLSVQMTNFGPLGWVTDKEDGYRYQPTHPVTGTAWPDIPEPVLKIWDALSGYPHAPEACLVNHYTANARMGLHIDKDEDDPVAPVVSISLGSQARFRLGGAKRTDRTLSFKVSSGDVVVLAGASRHYYHGVDRIYPGTSTLLKDGSRINLTLRRVTSPEV